MCHTNCQKEFSELIITKKYMIKFSDVTGCLLPCHANASCIQTINSYICECNSGYVGDGYTCTGMLIVASKLYLL